MENVALWNLAGKRWQKSSTWATRLVTEMSKWFSFGQISPVYREGIRAISNTTLGTDGALMILDVFSQHFWAEAQQKSGSAKPSLFRERVVLWSFLQLRQSIGSVMATKNIPSNAASASLECTRGFLRIRSVNVRLCWTEALGFAKINKFCAAMAMETRRVSIYVTAAGWIEVSVDEHFTAGTFEAFIYSLFMFFHWYCSGFTIVIDGIHVFWSDDFACLQSRKCRRRHPCKSQDVPWRSAMAWECRRFVRFKAVQTIRVFGRQMQKWWRWKPWKWCRHRWRELFNGNCFVLGQLFPIRSNSQGSSAYDNRETWHYYTADPKAPRFCQLDGAVLDWNLWRWTWCPLDIRRFQPLPRQWLGDQTSHSRTTWTRLQLCWVSWFSHVDCKSRKKLLPHPPTIS